MDIHKPAKLQLPGDALLVAFCDGPNGVGMRLMIWESKDAADANEPAAISLDFKNSATVLDFWAINMQMISKVYIGLARMRAGLN